MKKRVKWILLLCLISAASMLTPGRAAYAGYSKNSAENTASGGFDPSNWLLFGGSGVSVSAQSIEFDTTSSSLRAVTTTSANDTHASFPDRDAVDLFDADIAFALERAGGRFAFMFGLNSSTSSYGSAGSSIIWFNIKSNQLYAGISHHATANVQTVIYPETKISNWNTAAVIKLGVKSVRQYTDQAYADKLDVTVGIGTTTDISTSALSGCIGTGYMGFATSASVKAGVTTCSLFTYQYLTASNSSDGTCYAVADFANDSYNVNEWYSEGRFGYFRPTGMEISGGKMRFNNLATSAFSAKLAYSNFEMKFTVSDIQKTPLKDGAPALKTYDPLKSLESQYDSVVSAGFYVIMGSLEYAGVSLSTPYVFFEPYYRNSSEPTDITLDSDSHFTAVPDCTRLTVFDGSAYQYFELDDNLWGGSYGAVAITVVMEDGALSVSYSFDGGAQKAVDGIAPFEITPYGYPMIAAMGYKRNVGLWLDETGTAYRLKQVQFSLSGISLLNKDYGAADQAVTPVYVSNEATDFHYNYADSWDRSDLLG
jgi:hypothetical protein